MPNQHAILSPSAAHRWLHCTAAPLLESEEKDEETDFALEGTLAHAYCAKKLKSLLGLSTIEEDKEINDLSGKYETGEIHEYVSTYVSIVLEHFNEIHKKTPDAKLLIEKRLDFSEVMPGSFGTSDAIIIADMMMEVIDFKYGKGVVVSAEKNPQMMIYAVGAYDEFSFDYDIKTVKMTIIQPRVDNISSYMIDAKDLVYWALGELKSKAAEAMSGKGKQAPGDWCKFCRVKPKCKALANFCISAVENDKLIDKELMETKILPSIDIVKSWISTVEEYALKSALDGVKYKGYKLVEGRSNRKITDQDGCIKALQSTYDKKLFMKPEELQTITNIEKNIGKKPFNELCGKFIDKPAGKPTLVVESDKRKELNSAEEDFKDINLNK